MREIVSPLSGIQSPFGLRSGVSIYAILGFEPELVFDFANEYYRTGGTQTTFDSAITHSRTSNATMVDSDGLLKWAPHNLALNSATPATQNITVISGADYTIECTGVSIALSGAGSGTVTEGNPVTITASTTTLTLTVTGSTGTMWAYRSDLGGMVDNPDRGDSYVPTTSAARYLPRRGHHVYNGSEWVNEGLLHESEARTNLITYSQDFTDASWTKTNTATLAVDAIGPDGKTSAVTLVDSGATGTGGVAVQQTVTVSTSSAYTYSIHAKANQLSWLALRCGFFTSVSGLVYFNLSSGTVGAEDTGLTGRIEDMGNGWYRCSVSFETDATDSNGIIYAYVADGDGDNTVDLDGTSSILIYGAQFEAGSVPSSYIPTSGATATRAAETLTVPSANLPWPTVAPLAVSIQMQGRATGDTLTTTRWYLDANNYITQEINTSDFTFEQADGGTVDSVTGGSFTSGILQPFNFASTHASTLVAAAVNGTALTDDTTPTALADLSSTDMTIAHDFNGTIKLARAWAANITEAGREEASS